MSGYIKIYSVGGLGGYMGGDGINPILFHILEGTSDRQWFEVQYARPVGRVFGGVGRPIQPMAGVRVMIPEGPYHPDALLDATILFFPDHFADCPSLETVREEVTARVGDSGRIDFCSGYPKAWQQLREEARPHLDRLAFFEADLRQMDEIRPTPPQP